MTPAMKLHDAMNVHDVVDSQANMWHVPAREEIKCLGWDRWERRPLTQRQLTYAALDAHVAVLVYEFLVGLSDSFRERARRCLFSYQQQQQQDGCSQPRSKKRDKIYQPSTW
jgi:hypothetical protein